MAVLLNDPFTIYNEPSIGRAVARLPEGTGFQIVVPSVFRRDRPRSLGDAGGGGE